MYESLVLLNSAAKKAYEVVKRAMGHVCLGQDILLQVILEALEESGENVFPKFQAIICLP